MKETINLINYHIWEIIEAMPQKLKEKEKIELYIELCKVLENNSNIILLPF